MKTERLWCPAWVEKANLILKGKREGRGKWFSSSCPLGSFQCHEGGQVPLCLGHDGKPDCQDGSNTNGCQLGNVSCRNRDCRCGGSGPCLPFERFCDGREDCPDGSDESEPLCGSPVALLEKDCESDEFRCHPGAECFPVTFQCDGHPDCEDGGDEVGCDADLPEASMTPQTTPKGSSAAPETVPLEHLTIAAIVALLITVVAAAVIAVWTSTKAKPRLTRFYPKRAFKQIIILEEHP
ncbi:CD320 antigen [Python bivittatus]|uniref:CD320 antigen n=1 Tax=Python bivittatus TaxID=176946 RepID=A0A9F2RAQ3_PYTBI|nr:CD320 antigen [Python bivittatus]